MCLAVPGKVIHIRGNKAIVLYQLNNLHSKRSAIIADVKAKVGEYVMVQMGIITRRLSSKQAKQIIKSWNENL